MSTSVRDTPPPASISTLFIPGGPDQTRGLGTSPADLSSLTSGDRLRAFFSAGGRRDASLGTGYLPKQRRETIAASPLATCHVGAVVSGNRCRCWCNDGQCGLWGSVAGAVSPVWPAEGRRAAPQTAPESLYRPTDRPRSSYKCGADGTHAAANGAREGV